MNDFDIEAARRTAQARLQQKRDRRETERQRALKTARRVVPEIAARYTTIEAAYLYGSVLRSGAFHSGSDLDIAVAGSAAKEYFDLWRDLEAALPDWPVDLRTLEENDRFARRVRERGEKIYG